MPLGQQSHAFNEKELQIGNDGGELTMALVMALPTGASGDSLLHSLEVRNVIELAAYS